LISDELWCFDRRKIVYSGNPSWPEAQLTTFSRREIEVPNLSMIAALHYIHSAAHPIFVVSAASLTTRI
jgi:hypothetical protein